MLYFVFGPANTAHQHNMHSRKRNECKRFACVCVFLLFQMEVIFICKYSQTSRKRTPSGLEKVSS